MRSAARLGLLFLLVVLPVGGCGDDPQGRDSEAADASIDAPASDLADTGPSGDAGDLDHVEADAPAGPGLSDILPSENPSNVLAFSAAWTTDAPATSTLEVDCGEPLRTVFEGDEPRREHEAFVMGLVAGVRCDLLVSVRGLDGGVTTGSARFEAAETLPDFLHDLTITTHIPEQTQPGWTLFNVVDVNDPVAYMVLADAQGRYRWYHRRGLRARDLTVIPEGLLAGGMEERTVILDWDGTVKWESPARTHHDARPSPWNDNHLLWLGHTRENCPGATREDKVQEYDLETGTTIWTWNICDHYEPEEIRPDWSHLNTVEPFPGERAALLSSRDQNLLFKVDRDADEIVWMLGLGGDFEMDDADVFYYQHAPEFQPDGNILLFDNGHDPERVTSRAIELALTFDDDGQPLRAEVVWEYHDESLFTRARGDADRLANGNTLITYGGLNGELPSPTNPPDSSVLREVTPEGRIVWELRTPDRSAVYRSDRVEPRYGGFR